MGLALANEKRVQILKQSIDIAASQADSAGKVENLELRVDQLSTKDLDGKFRSIEVGVRWPVPRIGELEANRDAAQTQIELSKVSLERFRQELAARVRLLFSETVALDQMLKIQEEKISLASLRVETLLHQTESGERSAIDQSAARLDLLQCREEGATLARKLEDRRATLAFYVGKFDGIRLVIPDDRALDRPVENYLQAALANRSEIQEARLNYQLAQARYHLEHMNSYPWFSFVQPSYRTDMDRNDTEREQWGQLQFGVALPIFNQNQGRARAQELAAQRSILDYQQAKAEIDDRVGHAFRYYQALSRDISAYEKETKELSSSIETMLGRAGEYQAIDPVKAIELRMKLLNARKILVEKQELKALARIDLYLASGIVLGP